MPYEYVNPHSCAIDCSCRMPVGTIRVLPNECLPTPEQEKEGITAALLKQFECPNLLHPTPPRIRRRLFRDDNIEIPEDLEALTAHLPEFGGVVPTAEGTLGDAAPAPIQVFPKVVTKHILDSGEIQSKRAPSLGEEMQSISDRLCSSGKCKNVENP